MANEKRLFDGEYKFIERHFNKRLIDAEAIERKLKNAHCFECSVVRKIQCDACWVNDVLELLDGDTVDAVPVVHGRWDQVQRWATKAKYRCSVCGREIMSAVKVNIEKYPYCHCGAKMDGGNEDG